MSAIWRFRLFVGPVGVNEIASRLCDEGIRTVAGTEHVHGHVEADDRADAERKLNAAAHFRIYEPSRFRSDAIWKVQP